MPRCFDPLNYLFELKSTGSIFDSCSDSVFNGFDLPLVKKLLKVGVDLAVVVFGLFIDETTVFFVFFASKVFSLGPKLIFFRELTDREFLVWLFKLVY